MSRSAFDRPSVFGVGDDLDADKDDGGAAADEGQWRCPIVFDALATRGDDVDVDIRWANGDVRYFSNADPAPLICVRREGQRARAALARAENLAIDSMKLSDFEGDNFIVALDDVRGGHRPPPPVLEVVDTCLERRDVRLVRLHGGQIKPVDLDAVFAFGGCDDSADDVERHCAFEFYPVRANLPDTY